MNVDIYTGWGQEAEEICFTTWQKGGECKVNKNTWYAHPHKGQTHGRMYDWNIQQIRDSYNNSYDYWVNDNKEDFIKELGYSYGSDVEKQHVVKAYETPLGIAAKYNVTPESISRKNNISISAMVPGKVLRIDVSNIEQKQRYNFLS